MIVCLCNGLNCRAVGGQVAAGASSVASVFRGLGCQPQCGTCVHNIREMILLHHGPRERSGDRQGLAIAAG
ncbi:MAG: bacterioferritin-associated ferredoxin [Alphaproteobacteria bacterium]